MSFEVVNSVFALSAVVIITMSFILCLPRKYPLPVIIVSFVVYTAAILAVNSFTGHMEKLPLPNGWPYIPLVIIFFKGHVYHKIFLLFSSLFITLSSILFFSMVFGFFVPYGSVTIFIMMIIAVLAFIAVYIIVISRFGKLFMKRFLDGGSRREWALYMITAVTAYTFLFILRKVHVQNSIVHFGALLFIIWSFIILCYAILNTHEKARQKYEAEFARGIITAGRDHYEQMNEQFSALRILRHDYKFHLNAALAMLRRGEIEKSGEYLQGLQTQLQDEDMPFFCDNPVINSLVADYARRCKESDIEMDASVAIPQGFSVPNYEMCIVLGNFLENAVEACRKIKLTSAAGQNRKIELTVKPQGEQLAIMVRNTFDGKVAADGEQLISMKKGGGIGLQSVRAVAQRHCENFVTEYDGQWFSAFVLWKKGETNNEL